MQRRTSKAGVVTATCLLILVSISPVSADVGVRAAPRPSSDSSDTDLKSVLAPRSATEVHADRLVSQRPTHRRRAVTRDQAASRRVRRALAPRSTSTTWTLDDLGSLVYGETQVDPKARLPIQARIIGGEEVNPPGKYPWMLGVVAVSSSGSESFRCGATLITSRYALSASHCFFSSGTDSNLGSSTISLKVGAHDIDNLLKTVEVTDIIGHPDYDGNKFENDITVLRLAEDLDTSTYPPVRLEWDPEKYAEGTPREGHRLGHDGAGAARRRRCSSRQTSPWFRRRRVVRAAIHLGAQASPSQTPCSALDSKMVEPMRARATRGDRLWRLMQTGICRRLAS